MPPKADKARRDSVSSSGVEGFARRADDDLHPGGGNFLSVPVAGPPVRDPSGARRDAWGINAAMAQFPERSRSDRLRERDRGRFDLPTFP